MRLIIAVAVMLLVAVSTLSAQTGTINQTADKGSQKSYLYQWVDDRGVVHVTDDLGTVPQQYRSKALKVEESTPGREPEQRQKVTGSDGAGSDEILEQEQKEEWQQRLKQARKRLADAQRRYQELNEKRNAAMARWAGGASGNIGLKLEADRIEQEMKTVQQEIADAKNELENVIPEEARKAGVPPGWLRTPN